jgi:hypothetical protein
VEQGVEGRRTQAAEPEAGDGRSKRCCGRLIGDHSVSNAILRQRRPLSAAQLDQLAPEASVYDVIYTPRPTRLLQEGEVSGRSQRQMVDQVAAAVMLQAWLDRRVAQTDS